MWKKPKNKLKNLFVKLNFRSFNDTTTNVRNSYCLRKFDAIAKGGDEYPGLLYENRCCQRTRARYGGNNLNHRRPVSRSTERDRE